MNDTPEEIKIQNKIRMVLSQYGIVHRRHSGEFLTLDGKRRLKIGIVGESDLEFVGHGFTAFIEVKTQKGRPTKEQLRYIERMKQMGHRAGIARSVEDALEIIGIKEEK